MKENGWQPSLSKMGMILVGSRELSNDMENGHVLKMLHSVTESITFWQTNSFFLLTVCHPGTTETSLEIKILEAIHIQRSIKAVATCLARQKELHPKLIDGNVS